MLQLIDRAADVLDTLASDDGLQLKDIASRTALNKATLCNILKSLQSHGFVEQQANGGYSIGPAIVRLAQNRLTRTTLTGIASQFARRLSEATGESTVVSTLVKNEILVIAKHDGNQSLVVNTALADNLALYRTASGKVLVANLSDANRLALVRRRGLPSEDEWANAQTPKTFAAACAAVRAAGVYAMELFDRQAFALAAPVFRSDASAAAALGMLIPAVRFKGNDKKIASQAIADCADRMSATLKLSAAEDIQ
ncbi:MAG: IclR family transcriptional regulator [Planctomycetota bacterium]